MSTETVTPPPPNPPKNRGLDEPTWKRLLTRINEQNVTPVIGSGACTAPPIDANSDEWGKLGYPKRFRKLNQCISGIAFDAARLLIFQQGHRHEITRRG